MTKHSQKLALEIISELDWRVFPANPRNKQPYIKGWQMKCTNDPGAAVKLFSPFPDAMVGIPTGPLNGITVVDIDQRDGIDGIKTIEDLGLERLVLYPVVQTPSGGLHFYISTPDKQYSSSAGFVGPGIDIRGKGGYIIGPGSISVNGAYEQISSLEKFKNNTYPMIHELREVLERPRTRKLYSSFNTSRLTENVREGSRNVELTKRCGYLLSKCEPDKAWELLSKINEQHVFPPLDERELRSIFTSIRRREGV